MWQAIYSWVCKALSVTIADMFLATLWDAATLASGVSLVSMHRADDSPAWHYFSKYITTTD